MYTSSTAAVWLDDVGPALNAMRVGDDMTADWPKTTSPAVTGTRHRSAAAGGVEDELRAIQLHDVSKPDSATRAKTPGGTEPFGNDHNLPVSAWWHPLRPAVA